MGANFIFRLYFFDRSGNDQFVADIIDVRLKSIGWHFLITDLPELTLDNNFWNDFCLNTLEYFFDLLKILFDVYYFHWISIEPVSNGKKQFKKCISIMQNWYFKC